MSSRASEKRTEEVRALKRKDENKICVNCKERGPEAVCTTFNTFVCMMCAGIHREYNHRIKNISTSEFTDEEVAGLKEGGNAVAKQIYFYSYKESDFVVPDVNEPRVIREKKVRDFIKLAYVDKKWMKKEEQPKKSKKKAKKESDDEEESEEEETPKKKKSEKKKPKKKADSDDDDESDQDSDDEKKKAKKSSKKPTKRDQSPPPPLKPLTDVLPNIGKLVVREKTEADGESTKKSKKKTEKKIAKPETNGQSSAPAPNLLDLSNVLGGTHNNSNPPSNDWADFGGSSSTTTVAAHQKSHAAADDWANFGSTPFPSSSPPAAASQPKPASNGLDDLFANNQSASAAYANFGFPNPTAAAPAPAAQQTHAINFTVQSANAPKHHEVHKEEHTNDPFADLLGTSHSEHSAPPALGPTPSPPTTAPFGMPNLAPINTPAIPAMPSPPAMQTINAAMGGMQPSVNPAMNPMMQPMMMPAMMAGQPGTNMTPAQMQQYFQQQMMMQQMMMQQMMMQGMRGMPATAQQAVNPAAPLPTAAASSASHNGPAPGSGASIPNFTGIGAPSAPSGRPAASGASNAFAGFF